MKYQLIIPPTYETQLTGFRLAGEKTIGKTLWRVEIWQGEHFPRVYRNGKQEAALCICPKGAQALGHAVIKLANAM